MPWVVGISPGMRSVSSGRSIELVDVSAGTLRGATILDGVRVPRSVPVDSVATADPSVRGVFSPGESEGAMHLAAAQAVDSEAGARVTIPVELQDECSGSGWGPADRQKRSRRLEENLFRRTGDSTRELVRSATPAPRRAGIDTFVVTTSVAEGSRGRLQAHGEVVRRAASGRLADQHCRRCQSTAGHRGGSC